MPKSMTGFGGGMAEECGVKAKVEIRALNHRFLEVSVRLPRQFLLLEEKVRQKVAQVASRGHFDIFVTIEQEKAKKRQIQVDNDLLIAYYGYLKQIAQYLDIPADISLKDLMALPGSLELVESEQDPEEVWPALEVALNQGLEQLVAARRREGERLAADIHSRLNHLQLQVDTIENEREAVLNGYRLKLQQRAQDLLGPGMGDNDRLMQEVVFFAERSDITEEIVRLRSHFREASDALAVEAPVGRRLDFMVQEMHREISTIGAKGSGTAIGKIVVSCKEEIEKIREQVQNLE